MRAWGMTPAFQIPPLMIAFASYSEALQIHMCGSSPRSKSPAATAAAPISIFEWICSYVPLGPVVLTLFPRASDFDQPYPVYLAASVLEDHWGATIARYPVGWGDTQTACVYDHRRCVAPHRDRAGAGAGRDAKRRPRKSHDSLNPHSWLLHGHWGGYALPPPPEKISRVRCILERRSYAAFLRARCLPSAGGGGRRGRELTEEVM